MTHRSLHEIVTGPTQKVVPAELLRPSFYGMLVIYYLCMALYGVTAIIFGITAIQAATNSSHFTLYWSVFIAAVGAIAAVGVVLSRRFKKEWPEVVATCLIVGLMAGYAVAIFTRAIIQGHPAGISSTWLPILIAVLPAWRLAMIGHEGDLLKRARRRHNSGK